MPSPNLGIAHVQESQAQKHVTINGGIDELDKATQGATALTISGNKTVTAAEFTGGFSLELSGTPGAAFDLNIPATRRSFRVSNGTDGIATVQVTGGAGAGVQVPVGEFRYLYSDGADVTEEGSGSGGGASGVETQEGGTQVVASSTILDFDGDDFNLADGGSGKTTIALADQGLETRVNNTGGDQNIGASRTQVQWDNEIRDEGAWHDPATDNERIVIGTEIVDVHCELTLLNLASADVEARVARYNSADALQEVVTKEITQGASITLQAMNVRGGAAGDYLVVDLLSSDASYDVDGSESYLMVRRARAGGGGGGGSAYAGCKAIQTAGQAISASTNEVIELGVASGSDDAWDTDSFVNLDPDNYISIPAAFNGRRGTVNAGLSAESNPGIWKHSIERSTDNGASWQPVKINGNNNSYFGQSSVSVDVTLKSGDRYRHTVVSDTSLNTSGNRLCCLSLTVH